jgi:hypothetical protein
MISVPEVECLHCKHKGKCITDPDRIETVDNIIVRPIKCTVCHHAWKDFYEANKDENSIILELSRNPSNNNSRSASGEGNNKLPESEKDSCNDEHESIKASG